MQPPRPDLVAKAIAPDYALGAHVAALGPGVRRRALRCRPSDATACSSANTARGIASRRPATRWCSCPSPMASRSGMPRRCAHRIRERQGRGLGPARGRRDRQARRAAGGGRRRQHRSGAPRRSGVSASSRNERFAPRLASSVSSAGGACRAIRPRGRDVRREPRARRGRSARQSVRPVRQNFHAQGREGGQFERAFDERAADAGIAHAPRSRCGSRASSRRTGRSTSIANRATPLPDSVELTVTRSKVASGMSSTRAPAWQY